MAKRARKQYTEAQRQEILNAALKEGLTALQVQKKFGVTPVTYYSWRKKKGLQGPRGRRPAGGRGGDVSAQVRAGVQAKVREILPGIVRDEVGRYLDSLFGPAGRKGGARGKK